MKCQLVSIDLWIPANVYAIEHVACVFPGKLNDHYTQRKASDISYSRRLTWFIGLLIRGR
jgi:hypothetical protein